MTNQVLVFDTETSGLFPKNPEDTGFSNIEKYPHIVQLSFVVYNTERNKIIIKYNTYIKPTANSNIDFTSEAFKVNGITKEMCENGKSIVEALSDFYLYYLSCDRIVAHNIDYDKKMIELELIRYGNELIAHLGTKMTANPLLLFNNTFNNLSKIETYCTMNKGKHVCNIMIHGKFGEFKKQPKLVELYQKLFKETPMDLHDSLVDCMVCLKCYMHMEHKVNLILDLKCQ